MRLIRTTVKNFARHQDTDLAAGLTYYAVFAIMPALLALVSLLSLVGDATSVRSTVRDIAKPLLSGSRVHDVDVLLQHVLDVSGAPLTLAAGAAVALWSASGYVGAFGRAMNRIREVEETRPFWKLRPLMLLITLAAIVLNAAGLVIIIVSGPLARSVGDKLGIGRDTVRIWDIAKWPVLAIVVLVVVALLYHATPNIKAGRLRLLSAGAFVALLVWAAASAGFAFYVANFSSYNKTYGSIAGVIIALLWLWLTNVALLFGAEIDAARDARKAATAMTAEPTHGEHPEVVAVPLTSSGRPRRPNESFPVRAGEPPYGPVLQPIPDED